MAPPSATNLEAPKIRSRPVSPSAGEIGGRYIQATGAQVRARVAKIPLFKPGGRDKTFHYNRRIDRQVATKTPKIPIQVTTFKSSKTQELAAKKASYKPAFEIAGGLLTAFEAIGTTLPRARGLSVRVAKNQRLCA
jgi:hypothetical protein